MSQRYFLHPRIREFESRFPLQIKDMRNSGCQFEKFYGALAKRLCSGLQIRLVRFDSGTRLHFLPEPRSRTGLDGFAIRYITALLTRRKTF